MKKSHSILIVDDEENVCTSLKRALRNEPYEILTAQSANEGMEILKNHEIELVISDFLMPEMSGIEFFRQIRVLYPYTLRVMLTGKAGYKEAIQAINEKLVASSVSRAMIPSTTTNSMARRRRARRWRRMPDLRVSPGQLTPRPPDHPVPLPRRTCAN